MCFTTPKPCHHVPRRIGECLANPFTSYRVLPSDLPIPSLDFEFRSPCAEIESFNSNQPPSSSKYATSVSLHRSSPPPSPSPRHVLPRERVLVVDPSTQRYRRRSRARAAAAILFAAGQRRQVMSSQRRHLLHRFLPIQPQPFASSAVVTTAGDQRAPSTAVATSATSPPVPATSSQPRCHMVATCMTCHSPLVPLVSGTCLTTGPHVSSTLPNPRSKSSLTCGSRMCLDAMNLVHRGPP